MSCQRRWKKRMWVVHTALHHTINKDFDVRPTRTFAHCWHIKGSITNISYTATVYPQVTQFTWSVRQVSLFVYRTEQRKYEYCVQHISLSGSTQTEVPHKQTDRQKRSKHQFNQRFFAPVLPLSLYIGFQWFGLCGCGAIRGGSLSLGAGFVFIFLVG